MAKVRKVERKTKLIWIFTLGLSSNNPGLLRNKAGLLQNKAGLFDFSSSFTDSVDTFALS